MPERLDLGKSGRTLLVFQCNHYDPYDPEQKQCETWEGGGGANACFILDSDEISDGLTPMPADLPQLEPEIRIIEWLAHDDGISLNEVLAFYDDNQIFEIPQETRYGVYGGTKLGSVPYWVQNPSEALGEEWTFIGQLGCLYRFFKEPSVQNSDYTSIDSSEDGSVGYVDAPNFGDAGIGYIFLRHQYEKPDGWFFWQCG